MTFRKALSELTTCLRERLFRWQQIEKICGFQIAHNSGLPSLTSSLYSDHSWVVMPRVSIPPYPIAGGVDDLDEDTPPIVSQFPGKCSGRSSGKPWFSFDLFGVMYFKTYGGKICSSLLLFNIPFLFESTMRDSNIYSLCMCYIFCLRTLPDQEARILNLHDAPPIYISTVVICNPL